MRKSYMAITPILTLLFVGFSLFSPIKGFALIIIDDYMTREEKNSTGVSKLKYQEFIALENWLNRNFCPRTCGDYEEEGDLSISENFNGGSQIGLSNGKFYQISPQDRTISSGWLTPFPIHIGKNSDPDYPLLIIDMQTRSSVRAKEIQEDQIPKPLIMPAPTQTPLLPPAPVPTPEQPPTAKPLPKSQVPRPVPESMPTTPKP